MSLEDSARRVASRRILGLAEDGPPEGVGEYGGRGPFRLPADHVPAIRVPKGGSCCANCAFVDAEARACREPNYVLWNGGDPALPAELALDEFCSDWYVPAAGTVESVPGPEPG